MDGRGEPAGPVREGPAPSGSFSAASIWRSFSLRLSSLCSRPAVEDGSGEDAFVSSQRSSTTGVTGILRRVQAVTEFQYMPKTQRPIGSKDVDKNDVPFIAECLNNLFLFQESAGRAGSSEKTAGGTGTNPSGNIRWMITHGMYERPIPAGDILIGEGDTGLGASEMYVVKHGQFEVLQRRNGINIRVNTKGPGDVFGEISLIYTQPRSATVCATKNSAVWVLDRKTFRNYVAELGKEREDREKDRGQDKEEGEKREADQPSTSQASQSTQKRQDNLAIELFMNQVQILAHMSFEEKLAFKEAVVEKRYSKGDVVVREGEEGGTFFIIRSGEATVYQHYGVKGNLEPSGPGVCSAKKQRRINKLFEAEYFGEGALMEDSSRRKATVVADTDLVCYTLDKDNFLRLIGPQYDLLLQEKSPNAVGTRLMKMASLGGPSRQSAMVNIKRRRYSNTHKKWVWEMVRAIGHLDEVWELNDLEFSATASDQGTAKTSSAKSVSEPDDVVLNLVEGVVLGTGAFSRVSSVAEQGSNRTYALKRVRKTAMMRCPEHVFSEQAITRNLTHPFCIRQYGSFQDKYHLYFLFDLMPGGDLMDVLVSDAVPVNVKVNTGGFLPMCFAQTFKMRKGLDEEVTKFYIACITMALEYLHTNHVIYRDLKPENVFIDQQGYPKLGDFGFAKMLKPGRRAYTFCGTPGYVAPENILAGGYTSAVDWWGLGVLMYVLLTGRQPFTHPRTDDQMEVMRRTVDQNYHISFPPYVSAEGKSLILGLLERRPSRRLGGADIRAHPWFKKFDWDALAARRMIPPRQSKDDAAKRVRDLMNKERKGIKVPRESPDELKEAMRIFEDF
jgi:cGMP-dependent protein kinase 2